MKALSKYKGIIIGIVVVIVIFVGYGFIKKDPVVNDGIEKEILALPGSTSLTGVDDPAAAFVLQLLAIQNISFNTDFFKDPVYQELVDRYKEIDLREVGRPNPFLDIGVDGVVYTDDGRIVNVQSNTPSRTTGVQTPAVNQATAATNDNDDGFIPTTPEENN